MTLPSAQVALVSGTEWPWLQSAMEMACYKSRTWSVAVTRPPGRPPVLPKVATRTPAPTPHSVTLARAFTLQTLLRWGAADRSHDAAAVVSELLTNALRHALPATAGDRPDVRGRIRLGLIAADYVVLCAVADPSSSAPVLRQPDWLDESGRGLHLVDSLSDEWGYCATPAEAGKVVWATFTATRQPQPQLDLGPG